MPHENKQHSCCFFGHRKIDESPKLTEKLTQEIEALINEKAVTDFYFGSKVNSTVYALKSLQT